jgi:hypothetical protein
MSTLIVINVGMHYLENKLGMDYTHLISAICEAGVGVPPFKASRGKVSLGP